MCNGTKYKIKFRSEMIIDSNLDHIFHRILEFLIPNGLNSEWKRLMKKKEKKNSQAHVNE